MIKLEQINKYYKLCLALSGSMEVYHVGRKLIEGNFNFSYIGSGEGLGALGPGVYFTNDLEIAKRYAKYSRRPYLYKAIISTDKLYNPVTGEPSNLRDLKKKVDEQLNIINKDYLELFSRQENTYRVKDTSLNEKRRNLLKNNGISGFYIELPNGALEICIFDLSIISITESTPLLGTQKEYDKQEREDLIEDSKCFFCKKQMWDPFMEAYDKSLEEKHMSECEGAQS